MSVLKLLGLTVLCLSFSVSGIYISRMYGNKIKLMRTLADFFYNLAEYSSLFTLDFCRLIDKLASDERFSHLSFIDEINGSCFFGCNVRESWDKQIRASREYIVLGRSSGELLCSFSNTFGKCSCEEFMKKCRDFSRVFAEKAEAEEKKWEKNKSLISLSGVLFASVVFLILM